MMLSGQQGGGGGEEGMGGKEGEDEVTEKID